MTEEEKPKKKRVGKGCVAGSKRGKYKLDPNKIHGRKPGKYGKYNINPNKPRLPNGRLRKNKINPDNPPGRPFRGKWGWYVLDPNKPHGQQPGVKRGKYNINPNNRPGNKPGKVNEFRRHIIRRENPLSNSYAFRQPCRWCNTIHPYMNGERYCIHNPEYKSIKIKQMRSRSGMVDDMQSILHDRFTEIEMNIALDKAKVVTPIFQQLESDDRDNDLPAGWEVVKTFNWDDL